MLNQFTANSTLPQTNDDPKTPLLWVVRDTLGLIGIKFGCGIALCGACTVLVDGQPFHSCVTPVKRVIGKHVSTIEVLSTDNSHPVQKAGIDEQVHHGGYSQSGQIMSAPTILAVNTNPADEDLDKALSGNICPYGTCLRARKAIHRAAAEMRGEEPMSRNAALI